MNAMTAVPSADSQLRVHPRAPYHVVWLATNACNARCVHCSSAAARALPNELSTDEAKSMLDGLAEWGVFDVAISGGEPLTRRDLPELIRHATGLGLRVGLGSNGTTINPRMVARLVDCGLHRLQVSIDGLAATHDLARRWDGLFAKSQRAIEAGLAGGLRVHVCFTAHRLNFAELDAVIDQCVRWGVHQFNLSRFIPTGRGTVDLDLTNAHWRDLIIAFEKRRRELAGVLDFSTHLAQQVLVDPAAACMPGFAGCQAGRGQACITAQGDLTPCVMLPIPVGNIRRGSFEDIWARAPLIQALRDRDRLTGKCHDCAVRELCGGCRGVAYSYTGDAMASDPRCWLPDAAAKREE